MSSNLGLRTLAPFFSSEGAYCGLLRVLLQADTPLARAFRTAFSRLIEYKFEVTLGAEPLVVQSEVCVTPLGGKGQAIDLVIDTPHAVMAIEIKVVPSSARYGQLAAQYRGLRRVTPSEKRVCSLLVFPGPTSREQEVRPYLVGRDRTGHIT